MTKKKPTKMVRFPVAGEVLDFRLDDHSTPRFRASASKARVPREAAVIWQTDSKPYNAAMRNWPLPQRYADYPHVKATRQMQSYFRRQDVPRTVGETVVYKGMHPQRLGADELVATSTRPVIARSFANQTEPRGEGRMYRITIPPGTPFLPVPPITDQMEEHEILFPPGSLHVTGPPVKERMPVGRVMGGKKKGTRVDPMEEFLPAIYKPRLSRRGRPNMNLKGSSSASSGRYSSTSAEISQQSGSLEKGKGKGERKAAGKDTASSSRPRPPRKAPSASKKSSGSSSKAKSKGFAFKF